MHSTHEASVADLDVRPHQGLDALQLEIVHFVLDIFNPRTGCNLESLQSATLDSVKQADTSSSPVITVRGPM
jgi:hypothetical protein